MTIDKAICLFIRFLKDVGLLKAYLRNCYSANGRLYQKGRKLLNNQRKVESIKFKRLSFLVFDKTVVDYIEREGDISKILDISFNWDQTNEGYYFWDAVYLKIRLILNGSFHH